MHTLKLNIDDSIFDKFMGLLEILPKGKVSISHESKSNAISFEEAKAKVQNALENISKDEGIELNEAFDKLLDS